MTETTLGSHMTRRTFVSVGALVSGSVVFAGLAGCGTADAENSEEPSQSKTVENTPEKVPTVYFVHAVDSEALQAIYKAIAKHLTGKDIAVKLSTGEPGGHYFLNPRLIAPLVQAVNGVIVECNTAYGGRRSSTESHYQVATEHGFTEIAPFQILDEESFISLPVENGFHLNEDLVGAHFFDYDGYLVLSHFKGHTMAGFGGALKNISIGLASREGKYLIHSAGATSQSWRSAATRDFLESMADACKAVTTACSNMIYINIMNNLSVDCNCDSHPAEPKMADIGILASTDPVALDQACVDLIYASDDNNADLIERMESRDGMHVLEAAEELGVGSRTYELVEITTEETPAQSNKAVVFFSATGHTEPIAGFVSQAVGADLLRIEAQKPYSEEDLNYHDRSTRATSEQDAVDVRPAIAGELPNISGYDVIYLGHPIWWGKVPRILLTFAESVSLAGKTVTTFCTSGSSDIGSSADELAAVSDPSATWVHGKRFAIGTDYDVVAQWARELGL
ncbi:MAG: DUF362 domain-containing protein [Coriobacteriales bacterium]|nr:DUF362 domain-containing protein [Coriobacteriales bacterium]